LVLRLLVLGLLLERPPAQGHRALDRLDLLDVADDGGLVHLGPGQRVVAEHHDVGLAALQQLPLLGPLLRRVGLRGHQPLAIAAADPLALRADHQDAIVGERAQDVVVPLPHQRARHEDHRTPDHALLARAGDDHEGRVGLADADVEGDEAAEQIEDAAGPGDLVRPRLGCPGAPAGDVQRLGAVARDDAPAGGPVVGVGEGLAALGVGGDVLHERLGPLLGQGDPSITEALLRRGLLLPGHRRGVPVALLLRRPEHLRVVVVVAEEGQHVGRHGRRVGFDVVVAADLDEAVDTLELDPAVVRVERAREPAADEREVDVSVARVDVGDVLEHRRLDRVEQAPDLDARLLVAAGRPRLGAVVTRPQLVAREVRVAGVELIPRVAVEVPLGLDQGRERVLPRAGASLLGVKLEELLDRQLAVRAKQQLGLGHDVIGGAGELGLDPRRLAERRDQGAAPVEGVEDLLGGLEAALAGQLAQLGRPRGVPEAGREVSQRGVQLGPQRVHPIGLVGAQGGEVAVDAGAELERVAQVADDIHGDAVVAADDGLEVARLSRGDHVEHAARADGSRGEGREPRGELARHLVAPARGLAGLVLAAERAVLHAEQVVLVLDEVVALVDVAVGLVDLGQLAAAAAPEDHVHHDGGAGHVLVALAVVARQAEGAEEVVAK
jgi:hypothetical protein